MLDKEMAWNSKIEKPRILFLVLGLGLMHFAVYSRYAIKSDTPLIFWISILVFLIGFYLSIIPWTERFKVNMLTKKMTDFIQKNNNFKLKITDLQLSSLYADLMKYDLINSEKTSLQDFKNVLTENWDAHNSKIQFNMDGASCREFYDYFIKTFSENSLTMKHFFETSKLVVRSDGKFYKYNTIKSAPLKTISSKENKSLRKIFHKLTLNQVPSKNFPTDKLF